MCLGGALVLFTRPPAARDMATATGQPRLWRGAYHIHSTLSDGSGSPDRIAAEAARAGLDFVILTDHGDGTRTPVPPRYVAGVLVIDSVEISTEDGHYVALGLPGTPYPLAGEGRAVAEDVRRFGGIGIVAHPDSPRDALAWHDPSIEAEGFEWVNADTAWRTAPAWRLLAHLATYPLNAPGSLTALANYPTGLFAQHDDPTRRPAIALAAVDAHARIGWRRNADPLEGGRALAAFPSYRASLGTFGVVVPWPGDAPSGEATRDARHVLDAIREQAAYSAVFSMAATPWLSIDVRPGSASGRPGADAAGAAALVVHGNAPADASIRLLRNGTPWREVTTGAAIPLPAGEPGAIYRAEMWLPARRGWPQLPVAVSAARAHGLPPVPDTRSPVPDAWSPGPGPEPVRSWHVEHDPASGGVVDAGTGSAIAATLRLASGARVSQFSALVGDLEAPPDDANALFLEISASAPMRVSVQLREPRPGEGLRWRHSAIADTTPRAVVLPLTEFRPIRPATGVPPLSRLHALLLVMDTVNARPGDTRTLTVHALRWTRARGPRT